MADQPEKMTEFQTMAFERFHEVRLQLEAMLQEMSRLQRERDELVASANRAGQTCVALMVCLGRSEHEARKEVQSWRKAT